jgi:hypothetical protein
VGGRRQGGRGPQDLRRIMVVCFLDSLGLRLIAAEPENWKLQQTKAAVFSQMARKKVSLARQKHLGNNILLQPATKENLWPHL